MTTGAAAAPAAASVWKLASSWPVSSSVIPCSPPRSSWAYRRLRTGTPPCVSVSPVRVPSGAMA